MEIIKSKRVCKCKKCGKQIDGKYKVERSYGWHSTTHDYYHLSCYLPYLKKKLEDAKNDIQKFKKNKFKKTMILEKL